ncbi:acyltransferase [Kitasatospora sp. GP82]|uniref:acyltransferase family protein n=1 Tax=Kitasatospora sp. GP82 TaxID=3035089 RepID=UPI0024764BF8|nr:acyltransferase [Kitasatospora sp. GP82]
MLRLLLAWAVMVSHTFPLGYRQPNPGTALTHGQADVGTLAVCGFFVLSGLLITRSVGRLPLGRFLWHRALRILPGLWCCLLVTALVAAPLLRLHAGHGLSDWWLHKGGPGTYLSASWPLAGELPGIRGVLTDVPYAGTINGSLWSLRYEVLMYLLLAILSISGVLRRARWTVAVLAFLCATVLPVLAAGHEWLRAPTYGLLPTVSFDLPVFGGMWLANLVPLLTCFLFGALAELYRDRLPVNGVAAAVAAAMLVGSLLGGGFVVVGLPAWAYLLIWTAMRMPPALQRVGSRHDYSYGLYIYAFITQQSLAALGVNRWGHLPYLALSTLCALGMAMLSWHLVEAPAMRLKSAGGGWRPFPAVGRLRPRTRA